MKYLAWAVVALAGYSFVPPLMNLATQRVPSNVATFGVASMLAMTALILSLISNEPILSQLTGSSGIYVLATGVCLTISILAFFRALSLGPVSIVAPIFGLFLVTSSLIGVFLLGEDFTVFKLIGIGLAMLSIVFLSFE